MPIMMQKPGELSQYDKWIQENNDKAKIMNLNTQNPISAKLYGIMTSPVKSANSPQPIEKK